MQAEVAVLGSEGGGQALPHKIFLRDRTCCSVCIRVETEAAEVCL